MTRNLIHCVLLICNLSALTAVKLQARADARADQLASFIFLRSLIICH